jgi:hypothetical protein
MPFSAAHARASSCIRNTEYILINGDAVREITVDRELPDQVEVSWILGWNIKEGDLV